MAKNYFQFLRYSQSVVLGILLLNTSSSFVRSIDFGNFRFIIQLLVMLIFLELYILLTKNHDHAQLSVDYHFIFLFYDLFLLSFLFVALVQIITRSWDDEVLVKNSMFLFIFLFLLLFFRQIFILRSIKDSKDSDVSKKRAREIRISMFADLAGVVICFLVYKSFPKGILYWSYGGFFAFVTYVILVRGIKFNRELIGKAINLLKDLIKTVKELFKTISINSSKD